MKKTFLLVVLVAGLAFSNMVSAQTEESEKPALVKCIDLGVGYVPKNDIEALRASVALNNIAFKRFGVYTAFENGTGGDYFTNIIGVTGSVTHFMYLYAGVDVFTKYGLIEKGGGCRKDFGVGINPFSWALVKVGYSNSVGPLAEIGVRIPLGKN